MATIEVNGIKIYYEIHGVGHPLVCIGGFNADHTVWKTVVDLFSKRYKLIIFDNRGCGRSAAPSGNYSIKQMADDVAMLCSKLNITHAHFMGSSMGGFILQELSCRYKHLVKSATFVNSVSGGIGNCFGIYTQEQLKLIKANTPIEILARITASLCFSYQFLSQPGVLDAIVASWVNNPYPPTTAGYEGQQAAMNEFLSNPSYANQVHVKSLVIGSDQDLIFPEVMIKNLAKQIPDATYYSFANCGHLPFIEYPQLFAQIVSNFIDSNI